MTHEASTGGYGRECVGSFYREHGGRQSSLPWRSERELDLDRGGATVNLRFAAVKTAYRKGS